MDEAPIQNFESIDIVGVKPDGSVDLCIIASSYLDASEEHCNMLKRKIQVYVDEILSDTWTEKYGEGNSTIFIKATQMPHQEIINVIGAVKKYLQDFNIDLFLDIV
jgi:Family of unknown function (DUF6572)